jgi:hypothetical protein
VNAEFNWWLLIVGLVIGAGLVWLILADSARRDADVTSRERAGEARWIGSELRRTGRSVSDDDVADILDLHAAYLEAPPPDDPLPSGDIAEGVVPAARLVPAPPAVPQEPVAPPRDRSANPDEDRLARPRRPAEVDERHPEPGVRG